MEIVTDSKKCRDMLKAINLTTAFVNAGWCEIGKAHVESLSQIPAEEKRLGYAHDQQSEVDYLFLAAATPSCSTHFHNGQAHLCSDSSHVKSYLGFWFKVFSSRLKKVKRIMWSSNIFHAFSSFLEPLWTRKILIVIDDALPGSRTSSTNSTKTKVFGWTLFRI